MELDGVPPTSREEVSDIATECGWVGLVGGVVVVIVSGN